jgi:hypothetical protein
MNDREFERMIYKLKMLRQEKKDIENDIKEIEQKIKDEFNARGTERVDFETIGQGLSYSTVNKTSIDEDVLLNILEKLDVDECIEMKPTVNEDKVQELIYKGILSIDDISPAVIDKSYKTLKFGKLKK